MRAGAPHASEIPYVFGTLTAREGSTLTPEDQAVARMAHSYWVNFAKTGDPNGEGLPTWPRYAASRDLISISGPMGLRAPAPIPGKRGLT